MRIRIPPRTAWRYHHGAALAAMVLASLLLQRPAAAQSVTGGDFDICDNMGTVVGKRASLVGRAGFGSDRGTFVLMNAATEEQDCAHDGFTAGVDFLNLVVSDTTDFVNVADPSKVILRSNLVIADFLNPLRNGFSNSVTFYVNIPGGTPAGRYRGRFSVRDLVIPIGLNPNGEALRTDFIDVDVEVLAEGGFGLVEPDTALKADSIVLSGKPGQTANALVRIANLGNVNLANAHLDVTDLVASSGTGLRIRSEQISFSPTTLSTIGVGDTARVTISARIPTGILAGQYRGDLIVQADGVNSITIPISINVTTPGDIVFENNPVIGRTGDNGVIIFNADPGTAWQLAIFDMMGTLAFRTNGTVFAGSSQGGDVNFGGDQAVRFTWPLLNGRNEPVAGGMYLVVVEAVQNGKRRQLRNKLMVIR